MLELAPGVYSAARMSVAVRDRVWSVLTEWFFAEDDASIVMVYADPSRPGGQAVKLLGEPPIDLVELDGLLVARRPAPQSESTEPH